MQGVTVEQIRDAYGEHYGDETMDIVLSFEQCTEDDTTLLGDLDTHNDRIVVFTAQTRAERIHWAINGAIYDILNEDLCYNILNESGDAPDSKEDDTPGAEGEESPEDERGDMLENKHSETLESEEHDTLDYWERCDKLYELIALLLAPELQEIGYVYSN